MAKKQKMQGFTLIEMLLVMVIISIIIYASIGYMQQRNLQLRYDRTSTQMQQVLNAGLAYYVLQGKWPQQLTDLQGTYLPPATVTINNPWGFPPVITKETQPTLFTVYTTVKFEGAGSARSAALTISGLLPLSYTSNTLGGSSGTQPDASKPCTAADLTCYIAASVNIPGSNLNNASAVNFAGLYHNGACVPVPSCPVDSSGTTMTPQIYVVPAQVSGTNDPTVPPTSPNVYPISSFTAYAKGGTTGAPDPCVTSGPSLDCSASPGEQPASGKYWRVCLNVVTERGELNASESAGWGANQSLLAITRCAISNEPSGSGFTPFFSTD